MNAAEKIAHAAERKAFEAMLDSLIRKSQTKDVCTVANDFVNMVQKIHSSVWTPETFEMLHQIANDPDSKWAHYAERLLRECDPYLLRTFLTAAAYEGGFRGFQQARANSEKYDCNIPWIVLMDPTSACNMRCAGCWAAEDGHMEAKAGWTNIYIYPGYRFKVMDGLVTNFHLPESTLIMLVSAFAGREHVLAAYEEAVREKYRFFSFGDAMFLR